MHFMPQIIQRRLRIQGKLGTGFLINVLNVSYRTDYLKVFIKKRKLGVLVIGKRLLKKRELGGGPRY